jgi:CubicO group peptidase (beta-lactamase class C family)
MTNLREILEASVDDWLRFARMLLAGGTVDGQRLLSAASVRQMTTDHLTRPQRDASRLFLEGQGWGFGGSVDVEPVDPWNVPGRYGWIGGTGTAAHLTPSTGAVSILLTQVELAGPTPPALMRDFWPLRRPGLRPARAVPGEIAETSIAVRPGGATCRRRSGA